jgi:phosphopantothenoylcysteine decarboxylase / phosphopantothenate---cysteine ligase
MAKILLGITGSVAAFKAISLTHKLVGLGHECKVVITPDGLNFVTETSISSMGAAVYTDKGLDYTNPGTVMEHINLAKWADVILIIPASANTIAKCANGFADNLLLTTILASSAPIVIVPAMNQQMWKACTLQRNIKLLIEEFNYVMWGPQYGLQACGDDDIGRMLEVEDIISKLNEMLLSGGNSRYLPLTGLHIVITAGRTIEPIDPVRYISNYSSGKMGYALATAAINRGAQVTLITGGVNIPLPLGLHRVINITNAHDVLAEALMSAKTADVFIGCMAVCDYRVAKISSQKLKKPQITKHNQTDTSLNLELVPNPDIIAEVKRQFPDLFVVGFAAETENLIANAEAKLERKNLDLIVANDVSNGQVFGENETQAVIIAKETKRQPKIPATSITPITTAKITKEELASIILGEVHTRVTLTKSKEQ